MESKGPTTPTLLLHCPDAKYIAAIFRDENSNTFYVFITTFSGKNTWRLDERGCKCKRDFHSLTFSAFIILLFMICSFRSVKIKFINVGIWLHTLRLKPLSQARLLYVAILFNCWSYNVNIAIIFWQCCRKVVFSFYVGFTFKKLTMKPLTKKAKDFPFQEKNENKV